MSDEIERDLATRICGCATERQRRQDIKLIRAYGDRREREALEKALEPCGCTPGQCEQLPDLTAAERAAGRVEGLKELEKSSREIQVIAEAYRDSLMRAKAIIDARILALRSADKTGDGT